MALVVPEHTRDACFQVHGLLLCTPVSAAADARACPPPTCRLPCHSSCLPCIAPLQLVCDLRANTPKDRRFLARHAAALAPHTAPGWLVRPCRGRDLQPVVPGAGLLS